MISVLYVDDDETFCRFVATYFGKSEDFRVTTVRSGREAVDMALSGEYDIVVSDYHMPGMNGIDLLHAYREKGSHIPFILFTGKGREEVVIEAINSGAAFYLQKGGETRSLFAELAHKIRQAVDTEYAHRSLRESEEKFRLLFETASDGILLLSDWTIQDCNHHAAAMFGTDRDNLVGSDFFSWSPEFQPDGTLSREKIRSYIDTRQSWHEPVIRWKCHRADMTGFDTEISCNSLDIRGKKLIQAIIRDISERIRAELEIEERNIDLRAAYQELMASGDELRARVEELRMSQSRLKESEERYRELADLLPEGVFECDQHGIITYLNHQVFIMFGYDPRELDGTLSVIDYLVPEDRTKIKEFIGSPSPDSLTRLHEYRAIKKDGTVFPVIIHSSPVLHNLECIGFRGVIIDISERIKAEEILRKAQEELELRVDERTRELTRVNQALRESEERYRDLVELSPDAIMVYDEDQVLFVNPATVSLLGGSSGSDIMFRNPRDFFQPFSLPQANTVMPDPDSRERHVTLVEEVFVGIHGDLVDVEASAMPIRYQGRTGMLVVARDITSRKRAEIQLKEYANALEDKTRELDYLTNRLIGMNRELDERVRERTIEINRLLRQKDDFINQLGHDLKTPLTPLAALLPSLVREEDDPEMRELFTVLLRSVYSIRDQIDKILTLARLNRQECTPERELIHPLGMITQAIDKNWLFIEKKSLVLEVLVPPGLEVRFSSQDASSVFDNLISNAIKYTENRGTIRITSEQTDEMTCITVEDTGIGLTPEEASHVFDEFYMADLSRHDRQSSGLGLSIVKKIMDLYGGRVWVESEGRMKGSRFSICIPV
ncbi:MAG: PAS domain S-box protein [Methanospirillum sp.]|nr:PAS domain S-box protein [Methanospirillum sp.]